MILALCTLLPLLPLTAITLALYVNCKAITYLDGEGS
jgi:hypothetical protein